MVGKVGEKTIYKACGGIVVAPLSCKTLLIINRVKSHIAHDMGPIIVNLVGGWDGVPLNDLLLNYISPVKSSTRIIWCFGY